MTDSGIAAPSGHEFRRVGPAGTLAADQAFGVALVTLWWRVSAAGGALGLPREVARSEVAAAATPVVEAISRGREQGIAVLAGRRLVGFCRILPGTGQSAHTATLRTMMIDPDHQRQGWGIELLGRALGLAAAPGVDRVSISTSADTAAAGFWVRAGFVECGRRPGWIRESGGEAHDEIFYWRELAGI